MGRALPLITFNGVSQARGSCSMQEDREGRGRESPRTSIFCVEMCYYRLERKEGRDGHKEMAAVENFLYYTQYDILLGVNE